MGIFLGLLVPLWKIVFCGTFTFVGQIGQIQNCPSKYGTNGYHNFYQNQLSGSSRDSFFVQIAIRDALYWDEYYQILIIEREKDERGLKFQKIIKMRVTKLRLPCGNCPAWPFLVDDPFIQCTWLGPTMSHFTGPMNEFHIAPSKRCMSIFLEASMICQLRAIIVKKEIT